MPAAPNRILGDKYRLIRPLETGGMGSVWLAEHLSLASPVAVKLIATGARTATRLSRFMREARAAAASRSPHVVQVLDYGVDEGNPFIVMELLEGESLAERLQRVGRLSPAETELCIRHVSRGLSRAHETGIVHRDLKPANIFITRNEDEEVIKLFDFGIAKAMTGNDGAAPWNHTRTGSLLGTPYYMSPEQLEAVRRCDFRTDIWAMGVIAFECLLGKLPFSGGGIGGLVLAVCTHPLPVPSEHGAVPPGFDAWFARACARPPEARFGSAREAAQALRRLVEPGFEPSLDAQLSSASDLGDAGSSPKPGFSNTEAPSSTTFDGTRPRNRPRLLSLLAPIVGSATLAIALQVARRPAEAVAPEAPVMLQTLEPMPEAQEPTARPPEASARASEHAARASEASARAPEPALRRPEATPEAVEPEVARASPDLAAVEAGRALERPPPDVTNPMPRAKVSKEPRRQTRRPRGGRLRSGATVSVTREAESTARPTLSFVSTPGSAVLLDGEPMGTTPLLEVPVEPGSHRVIFISGAQRKAVLVVSVPGKSKTVSATFRAPQPRRPTRPPRTPRPPQ